MFGWFFKKGQSEAGFERLVGYVYRNRYRALALCVRKGAGVGVRDEDERTLLMHAVLADKYDLRMIRELIALGVDVNACDKQKWTALHFACQDQRINIVRVLIENGAVVDCVDSFGNSPLWRAVMRGKNKVELPELLIAHGAAPFRKNAYGNSPYDVALTCQNTNLVELFEGSHPIKLAANSSSKSISTLDLTL